MAAYAAIVDGQQRILLVRAGPAGSGRWFLPGGGVEYGESPGDALRREIEEETGQEAGELHLASVLSDVDRIGDADVHSVRIIYRTEVVGDRPIRTEVPSGSSAEVAWFPLLAAASLDLAPFVRAVLSVVNG